MADKIPVKANYTGTDVTSLGEFEPGDTVPVASGGTGAATAADARTNLGAAALAGSASQSFSMLNGTVAGTLSVSQQVTMVNTSDGALAYTLKLGNAGATDLAGTSSGILLGIGTAAGTTRGKGGIAYAYPTAPTWNRGTFHILQNSVEDDSLPTIADSVLSITNAGAVTIPGTLSLTGASSTLGYGTGAGGTVTQATSRTTGVTLNKPTGAITLVSAAGSATPASFTVTNSLVAATDGITVNQVSGTDLYEIHVTAIAAGSFRVTSKTTGGTTTEQPVFRFSVIKGASA